MLNQPGGMPYGQNNYLNMEEQKANISIRTNAIKNGMDIEKRAVLADISEKSSVMRAKALSDLNAEKELQRTIVSFTEDGEVILQKKAFNKDITGTLPLKVLDAVLFYHQNDIEPSVLSIFVEKANGKEATMFWNLAKTENRWVQRPFEKNGITFGFGDKKEVEIRRKFLMTARNIARISILPECHGWYKFEKKWKYAFPDEVTWMEVNRLC